MAQFRCRHVQRALFPLYIQQIKGQSLVPKSEDEAQTGPARRRRRTGGSAAGW